MTLPVLARVAARRALTLTLALLPLGASAVPALPAPLASLYPPADTLLSPAPDVVLRPDPGGRTVLIAASGQTTLPQVARRYGVTPGAVAFLPEDAQPGRLVRVQLPEAAVARAPFRPASVRLYRVRPGDTLASVARRLGLNVVDLLGVNLTLDSLSELRPGETLNVPTGARGLLVRIKPGQSAWSLIAGYRADLLQTVLANGVLPTELHVGDELLLPGIRADGFRHRLLAQEEARRQAEAAARKQAQYQRFLAWKAERTRARLREKYERQEKYEAYLAWKNSPERRRQQLAYERQVQYEAALERARQKAAEARASAAPSTPGTSVRAASTSGAPALAWPMTSYRLTSRYAERDIPFHQQVFHGGIDLAAPFGTPIYSAADGTVTQSGYGAYGLNVYTVSGDSTLIYGHMSRAAVVSGQTVRRGQLLGYVGCTGVCTGPHLHFEVRLGGQTVDPLALLP
ncbi:peptidoglycan DD-metalloendopeptidase family protein [Deinococcus hohokamensis]|uniref:Peptidoglycan DD-metalloendopeptidase family protein n=1 Tax=Deinococcus hohokamensis TaxID=309883 RepID=A0ABV9I334_9DEIO